MGEWLLSRRDRLIVARYEVPGSKVWTFAKSVAQAFSGHFGSQMCTSKLIRLPDLFRVSQTGRDKSPEQWMRGIGF
jgi:hypothetical protein